METWSKYFPLFVLIVLSFSVSSNAFLKNTKDEYIKGSHRRKRQTGYFYDRPNVSFNLPTNPVTTTTANPISTESRMPSQMYYAYPAPSQNIQSNNKVSGSPTSESTTSADSGYNYESNIVSVQPNRVTTNSLGYSAAAVSSNYSPAEAGYNYENQVAQLESNLANNVPTNSDLTRTRTSSYTYQSQNPAITESISVPEQFAYSNTGSKVTGTSGLPTESGYNYAHNNQIAQPVGNIVNSGSTVTSSELEYNYNSENTPTIQSQRNNIKYMSNVSGTSVSAPDTQVFETSGRRTNTGYTSSSSITDKSTSSASADGYNYQKQSIVTVPANNYEQSGYSTATRQSLDVSTNAPEYLPPRSMNDVTANVETAVNRPNLSYLPFEMPKQRTIISNKQIAAIENTPTSNYLPPNSIENSKQTNDNVSAQQPALGYMPTNIQVTPNMVATQPKQNYISQPVQSQYLPPVNSYETTKASPVPTPAFTYLPPV